MQLLLYLNKGVDYMELGKLTFKGGVHIPEYKDFTASKAIEKSVEPKVVYISLHQHVGAPCKPIVEVGENVKVGQKIGVADSSVTAPVHSSVSGVVKEFTTLYMPDGGKSECVVIESDGKNEMHESVKPNNYDSLSKEDKLRIIEGAGIVGLGGAGFPMHTKLVTSDDNTVDVAILNGAECEPFLTCDHRIMLEEPEKVIFGLKAIMDILDIENGFIGVEDNKMDAIEVLNKTIGEDNLEVAKLKTKFPQGDSYRLVDAIVNRKVPKGGRCKDAQSVVSNVYTSFAVSEALLEGKPLYERTVTVTGNGIKEPKNLLVKVGTPIRSLIEQCGGFVGKPGKIIAGGPMTGFAQYTLDTPITKTVSGIIVLTEEEAKPVEVLPCIRCGKCLEVCPAYLQPLFISAHALKNNIGKADEYDAMACIECGSCSYICPSKRPLAESIAHVKKEINATRKKDRR